MSIRTRTWTTPAGENRQGYEVGYTDAAGKRQRKLFGTKKEAIAYETQARAGVANGTHTPDSATCTVAVAAQKWLDRCDQRQLQRASVVAYRQHVTLHIVPRLGNVLLSRLTAAVVTSFEDELHAAGLSQALIRKVRISLGALLKEAVRRGLVATNVVHNVGSEVRVQSETSKRAEVGIDIPTPADIRALIPQLQGYLRPLLLTAIFTGLRWSELKGLTWANVDLKAATLTVSQRIDRYGVVGLPKSKAGNRTVPLLPLVVNALRELRVAAAPGQELVFVNGRGNPLHYNTVCEGYEAAQIDAGLTDDAGEAKYPGLHALRHFFASWCINRRVDGGRELPLKVVQGLLGHGSIQMTSDVYGHLFPATNDTAELAAAETAFLAG